MKKILLVTVLLLAFVFAFTSCSSSEPTIDVDSDGYVTVNGVKTEHKVHTADDISVNADGKVVVNGVVTEIVADKNDVITLDPDGYVVVNGVKTEYLTANEHWHNYVSGKCTICQAEERVSKGLEYTLSDDGTYYIVSSGGSCIDSFLYIPSEYNGLPVKEIAENAFYKYYDLVSVVIPDSVEIISEGAFKEWDGNKSGFIWVSIGKGVKSIGEDAFGWCKNLENVKVHPENQYYKCVDDSLYTMDGTELIKHPANVTTAAITIPDGTIKICNSAFVGNKYLEKVVIPDSVTRIGYAAFSDCENLTSVTIPDSVTSIGEYAFSDCESLTSVTIGNSVTSIDSYAFYGCDKLVEVINKSSLNIKAGSSSYGYIGEYAKEVHNGESKIVNKDNYLFYTYNGVNYLLGYTGNDTELTLPDSYNGEGYEIYKYVFYNSTSLTSVTIPDSVTSIGYSAFYNSTSLEEIYFNATAMNDLSSYNDVFSYAGTEGAGIKVVIGKNVTKIPAYLFYPYSSSPSYSPKITSVEFEDGSVCESIGSCAFYYCTSLASITIGDSVTSIGSSAFYYCRSLTSITIPSSVLKIDSDAFEYCSNLKTVTFAANSQISSIGSDAFYKCTSLASVTIPDSVTSIGEWAFSCCTSLTSVTIGNSVTSIGSSAFRECTSLTSVTIPSNVLKIDSFAFYDCSNLKTVTFAENSQISSIGEGAFRNCTSLTSVTIPDSLTSIGDYAFRNCESLTSIKYRGTSEQWKAISKGSFWNVDTGNYTITYNYTGE